MSSKSIFDKPFDDGTKAKLEIFKQYFEEWLPVFVSARKIYWKNVSVYDFFAGQGCDCNGYEGSPLIILKTVESLIDYIKKNDVNLKLVFNEKDTDSYNALLNNINSINSPIANFSHLHNGEFKTLFDAYYPKMQNSANFLFLDQNGIKEITEDVFAKVIQLKQTDFLFFISSSFFKRFAETKEFKKYFPTIKDDINTTSYYKIHRKVLEHYKSLIPANKEYYLAPFSIKKGSNIYGLIFGTNHTLGIEKFLSVAWKVDKQRGEANFDIDNDQISESAPTLFTEMNIPTKKQTFDKKLVEQILTSQLKTNKEVYLFTLMEGFLLKEANTVLKRLKNEKKIDFEFALINNNVHRLSKEEAIKIL